MKLHHAIFVSAGLIFLCAACVTDLDAFMHNPIHCENISKATCEEAENPWGRLCTPCAQPYDWNTDLTYLPAASRPREIPSSAIEQRSITTPDGKATLDSYFITAHGENTALNQTTLIYNHGNYGGIEHYIPRIRLYYELGLNVVVWEYRGYGKSQPTSVPTAQEFFDDAALIVEETRQWAPDKNKIIYYGMSLGTAPATHQTLKSTPCALVLETPFSGFSAIQRETAAIGLPESYLVTGDYNNADKLSTTTQPTLILHAGKDKRFPPKSIQEMFEQLPTSAKSIHLFPEAIHGLNPDYGIPEMIGNEAYFKLHTDFLTHKAPQCLTGD